MRPLLQAIPLLFFLFVVLSGVSAQIAIDSFTSSPESVQPGGDVEIDIRLENVGKEDIENILVSLDLTELPFAPIGSSSEKAIEEIEEDEEEIVSFRLEALSSAEPSTYKIPVMITYENTSKTSLISIEVTTEASIDVLLESSDLVVINEQGTVTLKFVNKGLTQITFLEVTLLESSAYEILSPDSLYIGEVDIGDFETEEFTVLPTTKNPELLLQLEYRDANNEQFVEEKVLLVPVYTEEEAQELGFVTQNHLFTWILILLVIGIALVWWIRRKRKKKHDH